MNKKESESISKRHLYREFFFVATLILYGPIKRLINNDGLIIIYNLVFSGYMIYSIVLSAKDIRKISKENPEQAKKKLTLVLVLLGVGLVLAFILIYLMFKNI